MTRPIKTYEMQAVQDILLDPDLDREAQIKSLLDLRRHMDYKCFLLIQNMQKGHGSLPLDGSDEDIVKTRIEANDALLSLMIHDEEEQQ